MSREILEPSRVKNLGDMPSEVIARICFYCSLSSVLRFLKTCKDYYTLVTTLSSLWRDRLNNEVCNNKFPAGSADYYLIYLAYRRMWKIQGELYSVPPETRNTQEKRDSEPPETQNTQGELHFEPLQISSLSGIPCFTTVDAPSEDGNDFGGAYGRYYPNGKDPFIQGILTDG
jgi:hypothetical protein